MGKRRGEVGREKEKEGVGENPQQYWMVHGSYTRG